MAESSLLMRHEDDEVMIMNDLVLVTHGDGDMTLYNTVMQFG